MMMMMESKVYYLEVINGGRHGTTSDLLLTLKMCLEEKCVILGAKRRRLLRVVDVRPYSLSSTDNSVVCVRPRFFGLYY